MIVTYNWLKEFVDFDFSAQELCDRLTMAGLEVDALVEIGGGLDTVVVARLDAVERHPDADRLTVCQVDNGTEVVQVVCGATNHRAGDLIALAQPGSVLPGDFKIKKSKIRGQASAGMLCSEKELGLAAVSDGIMILPGDLLLGQPVFDALQLKDYQIEIGLTPNRPDCLSVIGVAREVAAMIGKPLRLPQFDVVESEVQIEAKTSIAIENSDACPRYAARMIDGIKIGPSPDWLVRRLEAVGMRSINNIVDVTNYVMMELGHPLHAFDFANLDQGRILVKSASAGDKFTTLDDQEHELTADDLMICDGSKPVALAGVMGGLNSEVQDTTRCVLLEAAYFKPTSIRRSSKRFGLHTEASHRFERGADIDIIPVVLDRAASLMAQLSGANVLKGVIDNYPETLQTPVLTLSIDRTCRMLDIQLSADEICTMLNSIGIATHVVDEQYLHSTVPSFRPDIEREIDLIEEVARLYGYDRIPVTMPVGAVEAKLPSKKQRVQKLLRNTMVTAGFSEAMSYSFFSRELLQKIELADDDPRMTAVDIRNPLSEDQSIMRTTHVPSLLEAVARNINYRTLDLRLFELRPVFSVAADGKIVEKQTLTAMMSGRRSPEGWCQSADQVDFFDMKAVVEGLLTALGVEDVDFLADQTQPYLHPGKSCLLQSRKNSLGFLGELHPQVLNNFDVAQPVYMVELDLESLLAFSCIDTQFCPLSKFPDVSRDSALLLDESVAAAEVIAIVRRSKSKLIEDVTLFDLYTGSGIPEGKKSLALRIRYRDQEKTLTEDEVAKAHSKVINTICHQLGAEIR
jgi:phenylalanyl-tRNA synthetase beta chain